MTFIDTKRRKEDNKFMRNIKSLSTTILTLGILGLSTITASATGLDASWQRMDYMQQKEVIEKTIEENTKELDELKNKANSTKDYLVKNENEIVDVQKTYQAKKSVTKYNIGSNNDLMLLEMVLNSGSVSELFRNLDIAKEVYIQKNKTLNTLNEKEEQLLELREEANVEYEKVVSEVEAKENELKKLEEINTELEELIKRKAEELAFNPNDLLQKSNVSVEDMYKALEGTALYELAPVYVEAENLYGVNALFIAGLTAQESAWGTSNRAVNDNNLTGFGVYSNGSVGINAPTKRDNILQTTRWIRNKYLTPGASYYNGYGIRDVNVRYCIGANGTADFHWSENITKIATSLLNKINK